MSPEMLAAALGVPVSRTQPWADPLSAAMALWDIDSDARQAAFIAQIGHESGRLVFVRELWGPTPSQAGYEGRKDLGNTEPGDGKRFMGRGLIQITGRSNYQQVSDALGIDFVSSPELLEQPSNAALSAAWFWNTHGLNDLADAGDFATITRRINGGMNGYADRLALLTLAKDALSERSES
ncbi:glycoside hydrolase family 19 protein [Paraburkholderia phenoliruptrix]|uniref:glycoside hydrolase family 19 protein n=1 Tax=Paraburkholderia phenoliruptrix TaxID=252970 RepID=UPI002860CA49|nr:glycoside hydrolase family 19 protein [Paraburkholderia phenoliruptrix]MDR6393068.1 putative chitinase [Paraburkholderia phenoliruptrix]